MWYADIVQLLWLRKIKTNKIKLARVFHQEIFALVERAIFQKASSNPAYELHLLLALGTVEKLFKKFAWREEGSVSLKEFFRYLIGLTLVYAKMDCDDLTFSKPPGYAHSDFAELFHNPWLVGAMGLGKKLIGNEKKLMLDEKRPLKNRNRKFKKFKLVQGRAQRAKMLMARQLEAEVCKELLAKRKFKIIDFQKLLGIFEQITEPDLLQAFFRDYLLVSGQGGPFDDFVLKVYLKHQSLLIETITFTSRHQIEFLNQVKNLGERVGQLGKNPADELIVPELSSFLSRLAVVSFDYLLNQGSLPYYYLSLAWVEGMNSLKATMQAYPKLQQDLNRLYFRLLSMGQFHIPNDLGNWGDEERTFCIQLNKLEAWFLEIPHADQKKPDDLYLQLVDALMSYLQDKTEINYLQFKTRYKEIIKEAQFFYPKKEIDRLNFAVLGLGLQYEAKKENEFENDLEKLEELSLMLTKLAKKDNVFDQNAGLLDTLLAMLSVFTAIYSRFKAQVSYKNFVLNCKEAFDLADELPENELVEGTLQDLQEALIKPLKLGTDYVNMGRKPFIFTVPRIEPNEDLGGGPSPSPGFN